MGNQSSVQQWQARGLGTTRPLGRSELQRAWNVYDPLRRGVIVAADFPDLLAAFAAYSKLRLIDIEKEGLDVDQLTLQCTRQGSVDVHLEDLFRILEPFLDKAGQTPQPAPRSIAPQPSAPVPSAQPSSAPQDGSNNPQNYAQNNPQRRFTPGAARPGFPAPPSPSPSSQPQPGQGRAAPSSPGQVPRQALPGMSQPQPGRPQPLPGLSHSPSQPQPQSQPQSQAQPQSQQPPSQPGIDQRGRAPIAGATPPPNRPKSPARPLPPSIRPAPLGSLPPQTASPSQVPPPAQVSTAPVPSPSPAPSAPSATTEISPRSRPISVPPPSSNPNPPPLPPPLASEETFPSPPENLPPSLPRPTSPVFGSDVPVPDLAQLPPPEPAPMSVDDFVNSLEIDEEPVPISQPKATPAPVPTIPSSSAAPSPTSQPISPKADSEPSKPFMHSTVPEGSSRVVRLTDPIKPMVSSEASPMGQRRWGPAPARRGAEEQGDGSSPSPSEDSSPKMPPPVPVKPASFDAPAASPPQKPTPEAPPKPGGAAFRMQVRPDPRPSASTTTIVIQHDVTPNPSEPFSSSAGSPGDPLDSNTDSPSDSPSVDARARSSSSSWTAVKPMDSPAAATTDKNRRTTKTTLTRSNTGSAPTSAVESTASSPKDVKRKSDSVDKADAQSFIDFLRSEPPPNMERKASLFKMKDSEEGAKASPAKVEEKPKPKVSSPWSTGAVATAAPKTDPAQPQPQPSSYMQSLMQYIREDRLSAKESKHKAAAEGDSKPRSDTQSMLEFLSEEPPEAITRKTAPRMFASIRMAPGQSWTNGGLGSKGNRSTMMAQFVEHFGWDQLIENITTAETTPELLFEFLLTYRTFSSAEELLEALSERFLTADSIAKEKDKADIIRVRALNAMKTWIDEHWFDFEKDYEALAELLRVFAENVAQKFPVYSNTASLLVDRMDKKAADNFSIKATRFSKMPPPPILPQPKRNEDGTIDTSASEYIRLELMDIDSLELARQLTLVDSELFRAIQPWEFLGQAWMGPNKDSESPNIGKMTRRFNRTAQWAKTLVLAETELDMRSQVFKKLLAVLHHLEQLNNFNGVMAFVAAFQSAAIFRLKKTYATCNTETLEVLNRCKALVDADGNYANLRNALRARMPPVVPYLGLFLSDLTFIKEGNSDLPEGVINWGQKQKVAGTIREIRALQSEPYVLQPVSEIRLYLTQPWLLDDDALFELSLFDEPRDASKRPEISKEVQIALHKRQTMRPSLPNIVAAQMANERTAGDLFMSPRAHAPSKSLVGTNEAKPEVPKAAPRRSTSSSNIPKGAINAREKEKEKDKLDRETKEAASPKSPRDHAPDLKNLAPEVQKVLMEQIAKINSNHKELVQQTNDRIEALRTQLLNELEDQRKKSLVEIEKVAQSLAASNK